MHALIVLVMSGLAGRLDFDHLQPGDICAVANSTGDAFYSPLPPLGDITNELAVTKKKKNRSDDSKDRRKVISREKTRNYNKSEALKVYHVNTVEGIHKCSEHKTTARRCKRRSGN